ncbi:hypothetical protein D3C77_578160 [compost metagenome]
MDPGQCRLCAAVCARSPVGSDDCQFQRGIDNVVHSTVFISLLASLYFTDKSWRASGSRTHRPSSVVWRHGVGAVDRGADDGAAH